MGVFLGVFLVFFGFVVLMSVGVLMGRKPIAGSCGGVGKALNEPNYNCDICGGDVDKCDEQNAEVANSDLSSDLAVDVSQTVKK
ncbi:MAG: (Na+)-NQR maturation NqrM [Saccharospirillaceae bacterium]|nr:(Na+)-NQR maturation NqrM [Pseudomonadales bacterium]NRB80541.1 (Na+)-NQR maturation NqrM [Saccharospirillaceae bacterium]